jgi:hypothetical protein
MARHKKQYKEQKYKYYIYTINYRTGKETYSKRSYRELSKAMAKCKQSAANHTPSEVLQVGYHGYTIQNYQGTPLRYYGVCDVYVD